MDTVTEVTLLSYPRSNSLKDKIKAYMNSSSTEKKVKKTWNRIDMFLKEWEERFSQTHPESEVLKLNNRTTDSVTVSPTLAEMIQIGINYGDTLQGMFDITILPVKELWGFGENGIKEEVPSHDLIKQALKRVDYRKIKVDRKNNRVMIADREITIDVGGIAKGFALREIGALLDSEGYTDYLIVAGGDIISKGKKADGTPWIVGIQHPRKSGTPLGIFRLHRGAVVTSGDYERYFIKDAKRYHHIFNPKTGYSASENQSVTVWGMDPVAVDVLSTGLFCLPAEHIVSFVEKHPLLECVVVDTNGNVFVSDGWKDTVEIRE